MPHLIVKLVAGKSEAQKTRLTDALVREVTTILGVEAAAVSVAFEELAKKDWLEKVYQPDIVNPATKLYKKPGYTL